MLFLIRQLFESAMIMPSNVGKELPGLLLTILATIFPINVKLLLYSIPTLATKSESKVAPTAPKLTSLNGS